MQERSVNSLTPRQRRTFIIAAAVVLALVALGIFARLQTRVELGERTEQSAVQAVAVTHPKSGPVGEELVLPGDVQAYSEAPIYARTSGYLRRYLVDIGARVRKGQLLAQIDTPEVDQELRQARADLATARANYALARSSAERWRGLLASDSVSQQEVDEKNGDAAAKRALVAAAQANVRRLRELQSFQRITAPFAGVVTARNIDIGALVSAGSGRELFRVAATDTLRVYVDAPQNYAPLLKPGLEAELTVAERPGRRFPGRLVRTADAIDPASRTLRVEFDVGNGSGELLTGSYAQVHLHLPARSALRVPVNALIFRAQGMQVATVTADHRIALKRITIGRDFGLDVEVSEGLAAADQVVLNPPDSIAEGQRVRLAAAAEPAAGAPASAPKGPGA